MLGAPKERVHRDGGEGEDLVEEDKVEVEGGLEAADVTMLEALKAFLLWLVTFGIAVSGEEDV